MVLITWVSNLSFYVLGSEKKYIKLINWPQAKNEKVYLQPYFFKNCFSPLSQKDIVFWEKTLIYIAQGITFQMIPKLEMAPFVTISMFFSDNSVHWWMINSNKGTPTYIFRTTTCFVNVVKSSQIAMLSEYQQVFNFGSKGPLGTSWTEDIARKDRWLPQLPPQC